MTHSQANAAANAIFHRACAAAWDNPQLNVAIIQWPHGSNRIAIFETDRDPAEHGEPIAILWRGGNGQICVFNTASRKFTQINYQSV